MQPANKLLAVEELQNYWQQQEFSLLPHQEETAKRVIDQLDGRALLADEVGLGKTIEAGLILKEYLLRGAVDTCLILTPASLGFQWWNELHDKFKIDLYNNRKGKGWHYFDIIIASLDLAKREPHADIICDRGFDLVIVDEAQKLKNDETQNWQFVDQIPKEYLLLLTATPLQNDLRELYNLVRLLEPQKFKDYNQFHRQCSTVNNEQLSDQLAEVMIRNEREDIGWESASRQVELLPVELTDQEAKLYQRITDLTTEEETQANGLQRITLQREVCSSPFAAAKSLQDLFNQHENWQEEEVSLLLDIAAKIGKNQKVKEVEQILTEVSEQVIIFTEYQATQGYLGYYLQQQGYNPVVFNGNLSDNQKEWTKNFFQEQGDILLSTGAGRQGINLQFCNVIINYDLPWNPMRLEQRVGRVDRLGQQNSVTVYNLATRDTVEERIVNTLAEKINLVEGVIGELNDLVTAGEDKEREKFLL